MTQSTPDGTNERRLWCARCQLSVAPSTDGDKPTCPACGSKFRE